MSGRGTTGEKTEKATPKRLRDARRRGDVVKSKDVSSTLGLAFMMVLLWFTFSANATQLVALLSAILQIPDNLFSTNLRVYGVYSISIFMNISATVLIPVALFGLLVEFLQAGPVFALEKILPKLSHLEPSAGMKRMFSAENLFEAIKSIAKTIVLFLIVYMVVRHFLGELMLIPGGRAGSVALAIQTLLSRLMLWTLSLFAVFMLLDFAYQRYAYAKRLRMSVSEVKQEQKDAEGDPMLKHHRTKMYHDTNSQNVTDAVRHATALVVNPTHVAIAIHYNPDTSPVPIVTAKGEDAVAHQMRDAASEFYVPVLRNELLARTLLANAAEGEIVPRELFDIVAQVILWATKTNLLVSRELDNKAADLELEMPPEPPGENLTVYPVGFKLHHPIKHKPTK